MTVTTGPPAIVIAQTACGITPGALPGCDATTSAGAAAGGAGTDATGAGTFAGGAAGTAGGAFAASAGGSVAVAGCGSTAGVSRVATIGPTWSRTRLPASQPIDRRRPVRSRGTAIVLDTTGASPARSDIRSSRGSSATSRTSAAPSPF